MLHRIYLGLGSNVGDRRAYLDRAIEALAPAVRAVRHSPIYDTEPWGYTKQANFLNMVVEGETDLAPGELLKHLKQIEKSCGRKLTFPNGPREIDVDILLYDDLIYNEGKLHIPHPNLAKRAFVLAPLADLTPELRIPGLEKTVKELLQATDTSGVEPWKNE